MFLISKINPIYFFISLFLGFLFTYMTTPTPDIIFQYPTPENIDQTYIDKANICFKYKPTKVNCPKNKRDIEKYPIQSPKKRY